MGEAWQPAWGAALPAHGGHCGTPRAVSLWILRVSQRTEHAISRSGEREETYVMRGGEPEIALSVPAGDEVKTTTCYMCACRCGIKVHLKDGRIRYIEGNRDHPVNRGVLCAKGS